MASCFYAKSLLTRLASLVVVTYQLLPNQFQILNQKEFDKKTLQPILAILSKHLNISIDWNVTAKLYKFLLYEPGCFFRLHRDTERIDDMFGTLFIQLPSEYTGDSLSVRNPLLPTSEHAKTLNFSEGKGTFYAAFYADCLHEVQSLQRETAAA